MKYLFVTLLAIFICGCNSKTEVSNKALYLGGTVDSYVVREFEYDGCQYIAFGSGAHFGVTHKGNCKYCQQRNK